ncbi:MAG TPA: methionine--tRNA ligase [Acidimicrobiia bacterium]|nr:methionine--tRNA ligase [Acidimicrobiia bacterium]
MTDSTARKILVAVAWPYASGSRHLGHIAGVYLPADIFARFHRAIGNDVLMVSGSDVHGTPITVRADQEDVDPQIVVDRYHAEFLGYWEQLGISWDLYTSTGTENHREVTWDVFRRLRDHGFITKGRSQQFYDPEASRFLPDRYVEGTCPHCGYAQARGDQCDNCGRQLDPDDLIDPHSRLSGVTPVMRDTEHYFIRLSALQDDLLEWLKSRNGWRRHVQNMAIGFTEEGLHDRAISRDLTWGIPLPPESDDIGEGKRIYVWFEAVIGYLSASKEWARTSGDPEAWRAWWEDPEAESYYFIGKDNIVFHTVIWPAQLIGYRGLNLPTDVPANQYVTFGGEKGSSSRGVGRAVSWYADRVEPDALRYALASVLPEQNDTELSDGEIVRRVNDELVATWGNLVHRVLSMTHRYLDGTIPKPGDRDAVDDAVLAEVDRTLDEMRDLMLAVRLRGGLQRAMTGAQAVNVYLNERRPWQTATTDPEATATTLATALDAIGGLAVAFQPYLPFTSGKLLDHLGVVADGWARPALEPGTRLDPPQPMFTKMDPLDEGD